MDVTEVIKMNDENYKLNEIAKVLWFIWWTMLAWTGFGLAKVI